MPCRVALVGGTGYGRRHLATTRRLGLPLAGVRDPRELVGGTPDGTAGPKRCSAQGIDWKGRT